MFTGIIEELGTIARLQPLTVGARLEVGCRQVLDGLKAGDSVAVNGVCLTAVETCAETFTADVSPETLERSSLGDLRIGSPVNLERPLAAAGRLGGHIVQGHVDGTGEFLSLDALGDQNWWLKVRVPEDLRRYVVSKGSIAVDGISLTVATLEADVMAATIVPHTYANTNLQGRRPGEKVNLECDILAKYVEKLLAAMAGESRLTTEKLRQMGY